MNKKERSDLLYLLDFRSTCATSDLPFDWLERQSKLDSFEMSAIAMYVRFGTPRVCLYCRTPVTVKVIRGVDQWFCTKHCPVCYQQEWLNKGLYGSWRR